MPKLGYEYRNTNAKLPLIILSRITKAVRATIFVFLAFLFTVILPVDVFATAHQIMYWADNRPGAVSITFDDGHSSQYTLAVPALNARGLKGTFFLTTDWAAWNKWRTVAYQGHEIGSHTISHPDLTQLSLVEMENEIGESQDLIDAQITSQRCLVFSYPSGAYDTHAHQFAAEYYISARGITCDLNTAPYDFYNMRACSDGLSLAGMKAMTDAAEDEGKWLVTYFHSLDGTGYGYWSIDTFTTYLNYLLTTNLWVDTYGTIAKYARERESASLSVVSSSSDQIVLRLTDGLNNDVFDEALTIRSEVPSSWGKVRIKQGGSTTTVTPGVEGTKNVIYYSAVPDWGLITLENNVLYLTVQKTGTGQGIVTNSSSLINCGSTCSASFSHGTTVTLTATASTGSTFSGWTGCDSVSGNTCSVTMTANRSVSAAFTINHHILTATKTGSGSGTLAASGLYCSGDTCVGTYSYSNTVQISLTPDNRSVLGGWTGCDTATDTFCTIVITGNRDVTATLHRKYALAVTSEGTGVGKVTGTPSGIDCASSCSDAFIMGTSVQLTAVPYEGSVFSYWSGGCTGTTETCNLTMTDDATVTAHFVPYGTKQYKLKVKEVNKNQGDGIVTSADGNITCGETCSYAYYKDTVVTLSAKAYEGSTFVGWKPDSINCIGTDSCTVTIDKAKTVQAVFVGDYKLKVINRSRKGGTGLISSTPSGISCSTGSSIGCETLYGYGEEVTLSASADPGSTFLGWNPVALCPGTADCVVPMDNKHTVNAVFLGQ